MIGIIISGSNNAFVVEADDGSLVRCTLKGKKLKDVNGFYNPLAVGDKVKYSMASEGLGLIEALLPRSNLFWRYNEKGNAIQPIAANIDMVICVTSSASPPFRPRFVDRISLQPYSQGLPFLIVLNKIDLGISDDVLERIRNYEALGFETMLVSTNSMQGIDVLKKRIKGFTSAFVGQSGVGKSSLLNAIEPSLELKTGYVSEKYDRGRHVTTASVQYTLQDGITKCIDTPGFRRFAMRGMTQAELASSFPEFKPFIGGCVFGAKCSHIDEQSCAVIAALESGLINNDRYESYLRISSELIVEKTYAKKPKRPVLDYTDYDNE